MRLVENHKEGVPFEHYKGEFRKLAPREAAERCAVPFDEEKGVFTVRFLYVDYEIAWPEFAIASASQEGIALGSLPAQMLIMRYLLEGRASRGTGAFLPYREMPWGEVYLKPFTGRCLNRAAFTFGTRLEAFRRAIESMPAIALGKGDASCQIEMFPGYDVRLIVWEGDDEFPPNAQILFSDNFPQAFSAEDRTVVGDLMISELKRRL
ncbi:MAG: DUF3786 domain-containing protein [Clostridia bacterium]|nr:DUF3786 domain-containing protein [Clostridia bacterium]